MIRLLVIFLVVFSATVLGIHVYENGVSPEKAAEQACNAQLNGSGWAVENTSGGVTCRAENGSVRDISVNVSVG